MRQRSNIPEEPAEEAPGVSPQPARAPRRRRWLRRVLWAGAGLVTLVALLVCGALVYVQTGAGSAKVLAIGLRAANEAIAGKLAAASLHVHGGDIVLRDVSLDTPDGERVAHVELLEVRVGVLALVRKTVHLKLVRIEHPEVWLVFDADGMNLTRAIALKHPKPSSGPLPFTFVVDGVTLERGNVGVVQGEGKEARHVAVSGLSLAGAGRYAGPTGAFDGHLEGRGAVSGIVGGPLQLSAHGRSDGEGKALDAAVDLGLAGLVLRGSATQQGKALHARLDRLLVPPAVGRALTPAWTPSVPVELSGEGTLEGDLATANLQGRAGTTRLALQARGDVRASVLENGHLELRHVNLAQLLTEGPASDLALTADVRGGGKSLETLTGTVALSVPASVVRKASVGPIALRGSAERGTFDLQELRAVLPGLRVQGSGRGTTRSIRASLDADATDLALLGKTFGSLSDSRFPPLAGSGKLHLEVTGPLRHPGVSAQGNFGSLRVNGVRARGLELSADVPDVTRPLDANARLGAQELRVGERVLKPVSVTLLTRGRALDLHATTGGSVETELHLGGTMDEDRRGIEMETLTLRYPEASWKMEEPAHLRFAANELVLEPLRLVAPGQAIRLGGSKRGDRLDATLTLEALDLATLPRAVLPPNMALAGRVTLDARASGTVDSPALEATVDAADMTLGKLQHLFLKGNGGWDGRRARAKLDARGLGTELTADVDLPVDAVRRRKHEPVRARVSMPAFDVAQVVCAAVRTKLIARGCDEDRAEVSGTAELELDLSGHADAPVLQAAAKTHGLRYRKLPPSDVSVAVNAPERGNLTLSAKGTALLGTFDVEGSIGRSLAQLVSDPHPGRELESAELRARARIAGLQLKPLHDAELVREALEGTVSLEADLAGTVGAPTGDLRVQGQQLRVQPMDPTDIVLALKAHQTIVASVEAHDSHGALANLLVDVGESPANLRARKTFDEVPFRVDGKFGPAELARLPLTVGEGRQARRLRGTLEATVEGRGSLQAPVFTVHAGTANLAAGETALGKAEVQIDYQQAKTRLRSTLASINGGTLEVDGSADLDLSYPAIRRGLKTAAAAFEAKAVARHFDLAFLTGFTSGLNKVAGTLEMDARASGTVGQPQAQGQLEWKDGTVGLAGYGEYRRMHLLASATNDRISIEDLEAHTESGWLKLNALGTRGGPLWTLKASAEANAFPVFSDDQLVATLTLRTQATGTARAWYIELSKVQIPEAHVELPAQSRRDLQNLRRPDDIVLLRNGKPLDRKKARALLSQDRGAEAAMGGSGPPEAQSKPLEIVAVLDAPKNLWIKGQDLNVEVGLSPDFRVETGEQTELFGEVRIIRGRFDVLGRRFDFQRNSLVRFAGNPMEPALNVTALYNNVKEGVKVSMQVQGESGSFTLVPSSEPPLTESEIYTLLATGRTSLKRGSGGSTIGTAQAVSVLGSLAASQLKNAVDDKVGLDVLSIEAGDSGTLQGATLEAGKYVTDDLYLGYAGKVGADPTRYENSNAFRLEYQFLPRWSFVFVYGNAGSGSADIVWSRDY